MKSFRIFRFFFPLLLLILISFGGCSFFDFVGESISSGYQNTVAYFNSYYNGSRAFDEAEAEIEAAEQVSGIRGFTDKPQPINNTIRQKLTTVIDKCSNILQFYPSSALVDDALLLIGKSYYYQGDYLKAERKFTEFLAGYPDSPLNLEARAWYVKTLARLKKDEQAVGAGESLLAEAEKEGETDLAAEVLDVLGVLYERAKDYERSLAMYERLRDLAGDDEAQAWAYYRGGQKLVALDRLEEAARMFQLAAEKSDDHQFRFLSLHEYVRVLRSLGRFDEALRVSEEMLGDFRFAQKMKEMRFERGVTYRDAGQIDLAMDDFVEVDTTAARTEIGARASFELAKLYEHEKRDYHSARDAYGRATGFPVDSIIVEARKKQSGFVRYFSLFGTRRKLDSLVNRIIVPDSTGADSVRGNPPQVNLDSLKSALAVNSYDLGELFYVDIENPDSAVFWYKEALKGIDDSVRTPRINYIIAELAFSNPSHGYANGEAMLQSIIDTYPKSVYAMRAKVRLGIPLGISETDNGETLYKKAEAKIDSGNYTQAIGILRQITSDYPLSPFAPKSAYTMGWLYENRLSRPDSALSHYNLLLQSYAASPYAAVVRERLRAVKAERTDSSGTKRVKAEEK
jgi:tetratricopeptide (TPR) repeat protein